MYPRLKSGFTFIGRRLQNKSLLNLLSSFSTSGTVDNKERLIFVRHAKIIPNKQSLNIYFRQTLIVFFGANHAKSLQ